MKISSRLLLAEDKKKGAVQKVKLKMVLPAGEAKNNALLGPLLGQHQINIMSFCNEFNNKSLLTYVTGVPLPFTVKLNKDKTYIINLRYPTLSFLLDQITLLENNVKIFKITEFFDVIKIFSYFLEKNYFSVLFLVLGYLNCGRKKYKYKFI